MSQIKRARGQNKWVNNPQPETCPTEEDFCWLIPFNKQENLFPLRPIPIEKCGIDLAECHCAAVEQLGHAYSLYHYGKSARGVFRGGLIVCESIPKEDERTKCVGMLIYNRAEHERAVRDHAHYWEWRRHRNDARWQSQERGERDYDAKNMMHTFRLLLSGENILRNGRPLVRFEGEQLLFLLDIKNGRFAYDDLIRMADDRFAQFAALLETSPLPDTADAERIDTLLHEMTMEWEERQDRTTGCRSHCSLLP
ncbi:MAG: nucleotidyltransferase domain-containing protein [Planctomycetaceae bacterium]|nr:nucleotidyltransferase domain-containing protein [Planctomycetaceae bacterium]